MKQLTALGQGAVLPKIVELGESGVTNLQTIFARKLIMTLRYNTKHLSYTMSESCRKHCWKGSRSSCLRFICFSDRDESSQVPSLKYFAQSHEKCLKVLFHVCIPSTIIEQVFITSDKCGEEFIV
jgi:hypothetical protein